MLRSSGSRLADAEAHLQAARPATGYAFHSACGLLFAVADREKNDEVKVPNTSAGVYSCRTRWSLRSAVDSGGAKRNNDSFSSHVE